MEYERLFVFRGFKWIVECLIDIFVKDVNYSELLL